MEEAPIPLCQAGPVSYNTPFPSFTIKVAKPCPTSSVSNCHLGFVRYRYTNEPIQTQKTRITPNRACLYSSSDKIFVLFNVKNRLDFNGVFFV